METLETDVCEYCGVPAPNPVKPFIKTIPKEGELRLAVVGEAPGRDEARKGQPFIGYSGTLLRRTMEACGIDHDKVFFTNVCCCRPTKIVKGKVVDRAPTPTELFKGRQRLMRELIEFKPDRILSVGNTAFMGIFNVSKCAITQERGIWHNIQVGDYNPLVMPTIHPAALLRNASPFKDFCHDLQYFVKEPKTWKYPNTIIIDSIEDWIATADNGFYFHLIKQQSVLKLATVDIETTSLSYLDGTILCISISPNKDHSFIFTENALQDHYVISVLKNIANDTDIIWSGHNVISFDEPYMLHKLGFRWPIREDTMLKHCVIDERLGSHGLKVLSTYYDQIPDYSKEVKKYLIDEGSTYGDIPKDLLWKYAGMDTAETWSISEHLDTEWKEATKDGYKPERAYNMLLSFARTLAEVENHGALLDTVYLEELDETWVKEIAEMVAEIQEITGRKTIKPRSRKQIAEALFDDMDFESTESTPAGARATGKKVLKSLQIGLDEDSNAYKLLELILKARSRMQNLSTYVRGLKRRIHVDGRVRPHLMVAVAETGRLACRNPNLQNVPNHDEVSMLIRNMFMPTEGKVYLETDYSTLELRTAAWLSNDPIMIKAFNDGLDIHKITASKIMHKPESEVTKDDRFQAKFINFGIIYGREAESIAEQLKCSIEYARTLRAEFLAGFPVLNRWIKDTQAFVIDHNYVESFFGRRRRWDLIVTANREAIKREAVNMPISSMASDINLHALQRINDEFDHDVARVLFPVHDSILIEVDIDKIEEVYPKVVAIMQDTEAMGIKHKFPFVAEASIGLRWGSMSAIKDLQKEGITVAQALGNMKNDPFWCLPN